MQTKSILLWRPGAKNNEDWGEYRDVSMSVDPHQVYCHCMAKDWDPNHTHTPHTQQASHSRVQGRVSVHSKGS